MANDEILRRAIDKTKRGAPLSRDERRAFDRAKREQQDKQLREGLAHLPKKLYVELSGRQHKVLDEQATRYALPLLGKELDLAAILRRFHDLLAEHGDAIAGGDPGDDAGQWGEECKKQKALLLRLDVAERCQQLLRRQLVDDMLAAIAALLRQAGEQLQRSGNTEGFTVLDETLQAAQREIELKLGGVPPLIDEIANA